MSEGAGGYYVTPEKEQTVVKLLKQEIPLATIKQRTGLSEDTIRKINKKHKARPTGKRVMYV